jgi:uncharacterized delta-60 repeat protein
MRHSRLTSRLPVALVVAALIQTLVPTPAVAAPGGFDASFGRDGIVTTGFGRTFAYATALVVQKDGKILLAGGVRSLVSGRLEWGLARYLPDGTADRSFDGNGTVRTRFGRGDALATDLAVRPDGGIVVIGTVFSRHRSVFALARYESDGSLDDRFSKNGRRFSRFPPYRNAQATALSLLDDGRLIVVGMASERGASLFASVRYEADGRLDRTFGSDGKVVTDVGGGGAHDVVVQPDGRQLVAGGDYLGAFVRYRADGTLDATFAGDGIKRFGRVGEVRAITLQADRKIVAATGFSGLVRLLPEGRLDDTFNGDGIAESGFSANAEDVAIAADGSILLAGSTDSSDNDSARLARYRPRGRLDTTFADEGVVPSAFGSFNEFAHAVAIQADGRILVAGSAGGDYGESKFAVARFLSG